MREKFHPIKHSRYSYLICSLGNRIIKLCIESSRRPVRLSYAFCRRTRLAGWPYVRECAHARVRVASWSGSKSPRRRGSSIGYNHIVPDYIKKKKPRRRIQIQTQRKCKRHNSCEFIVTPAPTQRHKRLVARGGCRVTKSWSRLAPCRFYGDGRWWRIGGGRDRHARRAGAHLPPCRASSLAPHPWPPVGGPAVAAS